MGDPNPQAAQNAVRIEALISDLSATEEEWQEPDDNRHYGRLASYLDHGRIEGAEEDLIAIGPPAVRAVCRELAWDRPASDREPHVAASAEKILLAIGRTGIEEMFDAISDADRLFRTDSYPYGGILGHDVRGNRISVLVSPRGGSLESRQKVRKRLADIIRRILSDNDLLAAANEQDVSARIGAYTTLAVSKDTKAVIALSEFLVSRELTTAQRCALINSLVEIAENDAGQAIRAIQARLNDTTDEDSIRTAAAAELLKAGKVDALVELGEPVVEPVRGLLTPWPEVGIAAAATEVLLRVRPGLLVDMEKKGC